MSYKSRIETLRQQMNEMLSVYKIGWEHKEAYKRCAAEIALLKEAIATGSTEPEESFEEKANALLGSGAVKSYFDKRNTEKKFRMYLGGEDLSNLSQEEVEIRDREEDNLLGWIQEYREKKQYLDEYDNLPEDVRNAYVEAHKTSPLKEMKARTVYAETKHAEAVFNKLNEDRGDNKYVGEEAERVKKEFVELWHINQAFKDADYKGGLSPEKLLEITDAEVIDPELLEEYKALEAQINRDSEKYPKINRDITGVLARNLVHAYDFSGTPEAEEHNRALRDDLLSGDAKRQKAARGRIAFETINKLLAIPNSAFVPQSDKEYVENCKKYGNALNLGWIADKMNPKALKEFDFPKEIVEAAQYKYGLYAAYFSKYKHKFDALSSTGVKGNRAVLIDNLAMPKEKMIHAIATGQHGISQKESGAFNAIINSKKVEDGVEQIEIDLEKYKGLTLKKEQFKDVDLFATYKKIAQDSIANSIGKFTRGEEVSEDTYRRSIAQVALQHKASVEDANKTISQVNSEASRFAGSEYFDIYLGSRTLLELGNVYKYSDDPGKSEEQAKEFDKFYAAYNEYLEKLPFIEAYDKLPEEAKQDYAREVSAGTADPALVAKLKFVENSHAEAKFAELWGSGNPEFAGLLGENHKSEQKREFMRLWDVNQRIKEINPDKALAYDKLLKLAVQSNPDLALNKETKRIFDQYDAFIAKYSNTNPEDPTLRAAKANDLGALENMLQYGLTYESNEQIKQANEKIIANLASRDPQVLRSQKEACYHKIINDLVNISEEALGPQEEEIARGNWVSGYMRYQALSNAPAFLTAVKNEMHIDPAIEAVIMHKHALYEQNAAKYRDYFAAIGTDNKILEMAQGLTDNELVRLKGESKYYPLPSETKAAILVSADFITKSHLAVRRTLANPVEMDEDMDRLDLEESIVVRKAVDSYVKRTALGKNNRTIRYYTGANEAISETEADYRLYHGERILVKSFENGKSIGLGAVISYNEKDQLINTKPARAIGDMHLNERANSIENNMKVLESIQAALLDTNSVFVSNSPEYEAFLKNLDGVIAAYKDLGDSITPKQGAELQRLYTNLAESCSAYLNAKGEKLLQERLKGNYDERGELRYSMISNLSSVVAPEHLAAVMVKYKGYDEYQRSTQEATAINNLLDTAIDASEGVYGINPDERESIENLAELSRDVVRRYLILGKGDIFTKALLAAKMKALYERANRLDGTLHLVYSNPAPVFDKNMDRLSAEEMDQLKDIVTDCEQARRDLEKQPGIRHYGNKVKNLAGSRSADNKIAPNKQSENLRKIKEILDKSDKNIITSSGKFSDLQKALAKTIRAQELIGVNPNIKQVKTLQGIYKDLEKAANAYLEYKEKDLKATFAKNKRDPRGELRFNTISSLKSIIKPDHVEAVCNSYPEQAAYNTQRAKSQEILDRFDDRMMQAGFSSGRFNEDEVPEPNDPDCGRFLYAFSKAIKETYREIKQYHTDNGNNVGYFDAFGGSKFERQNRELDILLQNPDYLQALNNYVTNLNSALPEGQKIQEADYTISQAEDNEIVEWQTNGSAKKQEINSSNGEIGTGKNRIAAKQAEQGRQL